MTNNFINLQFETDSDFYKSFLISKVCVETNTDMHMSINIFLNIACLLMANESISSDRAMKIFLAAFNSAQKSLADKDGDIKRILTFL